MTAEILKKKQHKVGMVTIALLGAYLATMWKYILPFLLSGIFAYLAIEFVLWLSEE